jgi:triose/dihydroxyacetone kinase / FAD-AMP lyase (cyclizing)
MRLKYRLKSAMCALMPDQVLVERVWVGNFMTALDMAGVSLSLMLIDDLRLRRLDAPT